MNRQRSVWVALLLPGPDYPQRVNPYEIRVFRSHDKARDWAAEKNSVKSGDSGPRPHIYEVPPE